MAKFREIGPGNFECSKKFAKSREYGQWNLEMAKSRVDSRPRSWRNPQNGQIPRSVGRGIPKWSNPVKIRVGSWQVLEVSGNDQILRKSWDNLGPGKF